MNFGNEEEHFIDNTITKQDKYFNPLWVKRRAIRKSSVTKNFVIFLTEFYYVLSITKYLYFNEANFRFTAVKSIRKYKYERFYTM